MAGPSQRGRARATVRELATTWHRLRTEAGVASADDTLRSLARSLLGALDGPGREYATDDAGEFLLAISELLDLPRLASARNDRRDQAHQPILTPHARAG
jgi:hypothetical protein